MENLEEFLWSRARCIDQGITELAPGDIRAALKRCPPVSPTEGLAAVLAPFAPPDAMPAEVKHVDPDDVRARAEDHAKARKALEAWARDAVMSGYLEAFGYASPRAHLDAPVRIRPETFSGLVNWRNGEVSQQGLRYTAVRIATAATVAALTAEWRGAQAPVRNRKSKVGPSTSEIIVQAIQALAPNGGLDYENFRDAFPAIRRWMQRNYSDRGFGENKPSESTLYTDGGEVWSDLRDRYRRSKLI